MAKGKIEKTQIKGMKPKPSKMRPMKLLKRSARGR